MEFLETAIREVAGRWTRKFAMSVLAPTHPKAHPQPKYQY
jgi:hypothetical protein